MKMFNIPIVDEKIYFEEMANGLKVYILPNKKINNVYATFTANYGGVDNEFVPINKKEMIKVPTGIAHFLEHKMFESEDGIDPFTYYSKTGTSCNASTNNDITKYLFLGNSDTLNNVNYLLDFVQSPYFTDENVEKEKGIIEQEIKMYEDDPSWVLYYAILEGLFENADTHYNIAGRVKDIRTITKENLYDCYNTFYHPSNMVFVVTGNVDENEVMDTIRKNQDAKKYEKKKEIKRKDYKEKDRVNKEEVIKIMGVNIPKMAYAIKIPKSKLKMIDSLTIRGYLDIIILELLGKTTEFNEKLIDEGLINDKLGLEVFESDDHFSFLVFADTIKPDELIKKIDEQLKSPKIEEEAFERQKKSMISYQIKSYDALRTINNMILDSVITHGKYTPDQIGLIKSMTYEELNKVLKEIDFKNRCYAIVKNKE